MACPACGGKDYFLSIFNGPDCGNPACFHFKNGRVNGTTSLKTEKDSAEPLPLEEKPPKSRKIAGFSNNIHYHPDGSIQIEANRMNYTAHHKIADIIISKNSKDADSITHTGFISGQEVCRTTPTGTWSITWKGWDYGFSIRKQDD